MSVYLDANVIVSLFVEDSLSRKAAAAVAALDAPVIVSDFAALEFASVVARLARTKVADAATARAILSDFDFWVAPLARTQTTPADIASAAAIVRRLDVNLHGADALHVAIALRMGASLLTLDAKMRASAKKVGLAAV